MTKVAATKRVSYSVSIVLDRSYGKLLRDLLNAGPVWAVDSPANRDCAEQLWAKFPARDHLDGVTVLKAAEDRSPEQILIDEIATIDLHHGVHSANPPYTAIRVVGSTLTQQGREVLATFGFDSFTLTDEGFRAVRTGVDEVSQHPVLRALRCHLVLIRAYQPSGVKSRYTSTVAE